MHQKETKKNLDPSMRQPMRNHCTPRKCSRSCTHHFPTLIPNLLPHVGWAIMGSQCIQCVSDLLNEALKVRIKLWKTTAYFTYNSNRPLSNKHGNVICAKRVFVEKKDIIVFGPETIFGATKINVLYFFFPI